jgi:RNA polymerase sigma-70 factor, ECF subfamily
LSSDATRTRIAQLFADYGGRLYAYAYRRTLSPEEAKDVVADTYLITLRRLDSVPELALPWLFAVARRVLANRTRAAAGEARALTGLSARSASAPDAFEELSARETLEQAFAGLSPDDRETLMLVEWDGLSNKEAAEVLGCAVPTLAVRLHRARRRLAQELQKDQAVVRREMGSEAVR